MSDITCVRFPSRCRPPTASFACLSLLLAGCYLSHEPPSARDDAGAPPPPVGDAGVLPSCLETEFGPEITVFERTGSEPSYQGEPPSVVATPNGFAIAWVDNRGRGGLGVSAALHNFDGSRRLGAIDVTGSERRRVESLALAPRPRGTWVFWLDGDLSLWRAVMDENGATSQGTRTRFTANQRVPLQASTQGTETQVIIGAVDGPLAIRFSEGGDVRQERVLTDARPSWTWGAAATRDRTLVAWADRTAGGEDRLFAHLSGGSPIELLRTENVLLSHFSMPVALIDGVGFVGASLIDDSVLYRLGEEVDVVGLGTDFPGRPVIVHGESDGFILAGGGRGVGNNRVRLGHRDLRPDGTVSEATLLAEVGSDCYLENYTGAQSDRADAVVWVRGCEARTLHLRTRCRR